MLPLKADTTTTHNETTYDSKDFALGIGVGVMQFNTDAKATSKKNGTSIYVDLEGDLNLPEISTVYSLYGAYRFNSDHAISFRYFGVNREYDQDVYSKINDTYQGQVALYDRSKFYNLYYGYKLFRDKKSSITLVES